MVPPNPLVYKLICLSGLAAAVTQQSSDPEWKGICQMLRLGCRGWGGVATMLGVGTGLGLQQRGPGCLLPGAEKATHVPLCSLGQEIPTFLTKSRTRLHVPRNSLEPPISESKAHFFICIAGQRHCPTCLCDRPPSRGLHHRKYSVNPCQALACLNIHF